MIMQGNAENQRDITVRGALLYNPDIVWKTEGPTDCLAILSVCPENHAATCNIFGAGENPLGHDNSKAWILEPFRGKIVYVVHDADAPGQKGAMQTVDEYGKRRLGWAQAIALVAAECRNVVLPYPITETKGKDIRDYLCERIDHHTAAGLDDEAARAAAYADLLELAQQSDIIPNPDPDGELILSTPSAEELAEGEDADDTFVLEAVDDPHRLARINLESYRDKHGREIVYWNETYYKWKAGQYVELSRDQFESRINSAIKEEFDRVWREEFDAYNAWKDSPDYKEGQDKGPPVARKVVASLVKNVLDATRAQCFISASAKMHSWLEPHENDTDVYVSVRNGLLNLTRIVAGETNLEKALLPHTPKWFSTSKLPYDYVPGAVSDEWINFLGNVFNEDEESILTLQKWFGYLLTPDMSLQKILFIIGQKRSGKGTIINVLRALLGAHAVATPTLSSLGQQYGLVSLIGKTSAIIADARMPDKSDESVITERLLNITGGDPVDIQRKFKTDLENFNLSCRFTLFSNLLPRLRDTSAVFVSRCIFLPMPNSYVGREDLTLGDRIMAQMSGVLNWAIEGQKKLLEDKKRIPQPLAGFSLLRELQSILSPVSIFLQDCCDTEDSEAEVVTRDLFLEWESWCESNDITHPGDIQNFSRKLKAVFPGLGTMQKRIMGERKRFFIGVKMKEDAGNCLGED